MVFGYLLLAIALTISLTAAFYSIAGLTAIFAAAFWPIVIMGGVLELGKIVTTVWLHKYWDRAALQFKLYLVPAIGILMLITSMGIFGFLSKAHLDQAVPAGDVSAQVQIFDDKIKTERDNIEAARKALKQMDSQVDAKLARTDDDKGAERAVQIRRSQSRERTTLQNEIAAAQKKISSLQEQRAPIASQARKVEAEVGPIKYIAALIYGDNLDANLLEKAVRWVIILIVLVFDPLALVLILAADQTFEWHRPRKRLPIDQEEKQHLGWQKVWQPKSESWPPHEPDFPDREEPKYEPDDAPLTTAQLDDITQLSDVDQSDTIKETQTIPVTDKSNTIKIPDLSINALESKEVPTANFGSKNQLPPNPKKGDMFLRTDMLPNKLYKWNGFIWVEIDKNSTDTYTSNPKYIADLVKRLENNEFDLEYLTAAEQEQVEKYLNDNINRK